MPRGGIRENCTPNTPGSSVSKWPTGRLRRLKNHESKWTNCARALAHKWRDKLYFVIAGFDTVFVYHNGAESYYAAYAARAFRGALRV
jgi:hypothetical protein